APQGIVPPPNAPSVPAPSPVPHPEVPPAPRENFIAPAPPIPTRAYSPESRQRPYTPPAPVPPIQQPDEYYAQSQERREAARELANKGNYKDKEAAAQILEEFLDGLTEPRRRVITMKLPEAKEALAHFLSEINKLENPDAVLEQFEKSFKED